MHLMLKPRRHSNLSSPTLVIIRPQGHVIQSDEIWEVYRQQIYPASPTCCDGRKGFGCCWWPFLSSHLGRIPPKRFGTAEVTHRVFSGVVMVARRQLSEGPSNPPRKHTSRCSHCVKPVATKVMFGSSMVSYQLGNQETLESKLWSSGKSWPKCTLQPPRRNISIIINLPHHRWPFRINIIIKTISMPHLSTRTLLAVQ